MRSFVVSLSAVFAFIAAPVAGQSTSISATLTGDIVRAGQVRVDYPTVAGPDDSINGEGLGFNVAIGRALGERWGVALEVGRTGEIESRTSQGSWPLRVVPPTLPGVPSLPPGFPTLPEIELITEQQYTMVSALAWAKHSAGSRLELSYTAGLTFLHSEVTQGITVTDPRLAQWALPAAVTATGNHTKPVVGADAIFRLTSHTAFTAGVRAHGIGDSTQGGWLVRPGAGVRWTF